MSAITREAFDNLVNSLEEERRRAFYSPDTIDVRSLPMSAVERLARANTGAQFILHKWQYDALVAAGLI